MSHTMRFGPFQDWGDEEFEARYSFVFDSGLQGGDVKIVKTFVAEGVIEAEWEFDVPKEALVNFVAELIRIERQSQLDDQSILEVLGVSDD